MIQTCTGWILDVYIENNEAVLWIKTKNGNAIKLFDNYEPGLYLEPRSREGGSEIIEILSDLPLVSEVKWQSKFIKFNDSEHELIYVKSPIQHYNSLSKVLEHVKIRERIDKTYNNRLSHLQRYLFTHLCIGPSSKVLVQYEDQGLVSIEKVEDNDIRSPFSVMYVEIITSTDSNVLDRDEPIRSITARFRTEPTIVFEDAESKVLLDFCNYVTLTDPDFIVFSNYDLNILSYLFERIKALSLNLQLGRFKTDIYDGYQNNILEKWTQGRIYITQSQFDEGGIEGLIELSKFSYLPIRQILRQNIGKHITNRNHFELLDRNFVIPDKFETYHEHVRTLEEIIDKDKAGMIFSPKVGLHQNVAVLDFNDEFANIIVNENISYEGESFNTNTESVGILPSIVNQLIEKRINFRQMMKSLPLDSLEANSCKDRADTIKKILVCLYGTTASYWNKYGNVNAFEEINKKSRHILLQTKDIVQSLGFELVYSDTDACFVHKNGASRDDYEELGEAISRETGLDLSLEYHYKFLVLLPLEADEKLEALKHYYGMLYDGTLITRGIETRRHDTPEFIKQFQTELLYTLFDGNNSGDIRGRTLENALFCVTKTIDKVMTGNIDIQDLIISKQLRMDITKYRNIFPHVAAAIQSSNANGKLPVKGKMIQYIYTDSQHQNSLNRVATANGTLENIEYDKEKYKDLLLDAAETVLGIFGFDRTSYGKAKDKKWWLELKRNRIQDIQAEMKSN